MNDSPDTPAPKPELIGDAKDTPGPNFIPPPGARFFVGTDLDYNDASFIEVPGSKPGTTRSLTRDGSWPVRRLPAAGAREVSREEFEASASYIEQPCPSQLTTARKSVPVSPDHVTPKDQIPSSESLTPETLEKWERAPSWGMVWDHFRSSSPATLLAWLDKGPLNLRRNLAVKAMELSRKWSEMPSMPGPEGLVEAFQALYPETSATPPKVSPENAQRLADFYAELTT